METTKINMGGNTQGKKETEKVNVNTDGMNYSDTMATSKENSSAEEDGKKKNMGGKVRTAAAGVGGAVLGGGAAMAANARQDETLSEAESESEVESAAVSQPNPEPEADVTPEPQPAPASDPVVAPAPETSPHIEEILVDPDDLDGDSIMNIEGTGTVEIDGTEVNAAVVTDEAGNSYYLVDVDGEVNDPNATYDIIVDAETGEMAGVPTNLSVSDAQMMADNGIGYTGPDGDDSNNIAQAEMEADIYDPSQPIAQVSDPEPEIGIDDLADLGIDPLIDVIDPFM